MSEYGRHQDSSSQLQGQSKIVVTFRMAKHVTIRGTGGTHTSCMSCRKACGVVNQANVRQGGRQMKGWACDWPVGSQSKLIRQHAAHAQGKLMVGGSNGCAARPGDAAALQAGRMRSSPRPKPCAHAHITVPNAHTSAGSCPGCPSSTSGASHLGRGREVEGGYW